MKKPLFEKGVVRRLSCHWAGPGGLLAFLAVLQPWFEQSMARHMGLELPLFFIVGWCAARVAGDTLIRVVAPWNMAGIPALTFAMIVVSVWMVPSALDYAVLSPIVAVIKVASLVLAGLLAGASWREAGVVIQAFFVMNWFWMTLVVGILYWEAPQQLCSVYPAQGQAHAGMAMMAWAFIGVGLWAPGVLRKLREWDRQESG